MELFPFQKTAVNQMLSFLTKRQATYNACEMGLGKSAQALTCAWKLQAKSILIICPASVVFVWKNELRKWFPGLRPDSRIEIISYGKISNEEILLYLTRQPWDLLIIDEAHYIKSYKAKRTKILLQLIWPRAKYKICLSGTPMTQSIGDCWTVFSKIMPEFGSYWDFCYRYSNIKRTPWGDKPVGVKNASELKQRIRENFFVRFRKEEVMQELPPKTWIKVPLDKSLCVKLSKEEESNNKRYLKLLKEFFVTGKPFKMAPPKALATWRREQGVKKIEKVVEFVTEILEQEIPIVLFAYHKEVIASLQETLSKFKPSVIQGSTPQKDREGAVENFQEGKTNLFIGQIAAAGTGITLTRASTVVYAELDWSPALVSQSVDRCHRISQDKPVTAYYFSVETSIDEDVMDTLIEKVESFSKIIN